MPYKNKEDKKAYNKQRNIDYPEYQKQWRIDHKKERVEYDKQWHLDHKEYKNEKSKQWRFDHPEYVKQYHKQYRQTPGGKANKQRARTKRRAREREIINTLTAQEWLDILEEYNYRCAYCGIEFDYENLPTRDHVIPISKGGDNTKENVIPACQSCNSKKNIKIIK